MTDFYDTVTNPATPSSTFNDPSQTLLAAMNAPPPQPNVPIPTRPAPDTQGIPMLALLRMAAALTSRRQYGQSQGNHILDAVSGAADYASGLKNEADTRANVQYAQDMNAARLKADLQRDAQQGQAAQVNLAVAKAKAPLEMKQMQLAIETATDADQLQKLNIRLGNIKEQYANQLEAANLALTHARTEGERTKAQAELQTAQNGAVTAAAAAQQAQTNINRLQFEKDQVDQGKKMGAFKIDKGLPGEQDNFTYQRPDGTVMTGQMPMDQAIAYKKAQQDYKTLKDTLPPGTDQQQWTTERFQTLTNPPSYKAVVQDMSARSKGPSGSPASPGVTAPGASAPAPSPSGTAAPTTGAPQGMPPDVFAYIKTQPAATWESPQGKKFYIQGKEVDQATFMAATKSPEVSTLPQRGTGPASTSSSSYVPIEEK